VTKRSQHASTSPSNRKRSSKACTTSTSTSPTSWHCA